MNADTEAERYLNMKVMRFSNNTGSTLFESIIIAQFPFLCNFVCLLAINLLNWNTSTSKFYSKYILEFITIILPMILFLTVWNEYLLYVFTSLLMFSSTYILVHSQQILHYIRTASKNFILLDRKYSPANIRSILNILIAIGILAADFTVFPKKFLKSETIGYSLMDLGVGCSMASFAGMQTHLQQKRSITYIIRRTLPLAFLGIGRFITTNTINYHYQVSEYGVQWNYFLTLLCVELFNEILFKFFIHSYRQLYYLVPVLLFIHQASLTLGLQEWIFSDAPRDNFLSANREGIFSLPGYEVIYLTTILLKNYFRPKKGETMYKYMRRFPMAYLATVGFLAASKVSENTITVSRRTANAGFVFWVVGLSCSCIITEVIIEFTLGIFIFNSTPNKTLEAINYNGLFFFLLANVVTGIINLSFKTLLLNKIIGVLILVIYMIFNCIVAIILHQKNIRLR